MVQLTELLARADAELEAERFRDYCPNGLQVEGRREITRLVTGVSACQALIEAAAAAEADAILVHHGYFWRGEDERITGMKQRRIKALLQADISLIAYHLPLDAHPQYGNNAQLAEHLQLDVEGRFGLSGDAPIGMHGQLAEPLSAAAFGARIEAALARTPLHICAGERPIRRVAWCSGGAQGYIEAALELEVDAFLTGEASEQTVHIARENGLHFFAAGHHATERYGVQVFGQYLAKEFGLEHQFIEIDNPV